MLKQTSDTLTQIQATIDYVSNALTLPDYVNQEDVDQQIALFHLEVAADPTMVFDTEEDFHRSILLMVRNWLAPIIVNRGMGAVHFAELDRDVASRRQSALMDMVLMRDLLDRAIKDLTPRKKFVIERRYGLNGEPSTVEHVAEELGLSKNRIYGIHSEAIRSMRDQLVNDEN